MQNASGIIDQPFTVFSYIIVPPPVLSVAEHLVPYNGTNFTLSGLALLDENVDTNITATGCWSESGAQQVSMAPP